MGIKFLIRWTMWTQKSKLATTTSHYIDDYSSNPGGHQLNNLSLVGPEASLQVLVETRRILAGSSINGSSYP